MNPTGSQKQLLIAESELNRTHLVRDLEALRSQVRELVDRASSFGILTSSAVGLAADLVSPRQGRPRESATPISWLPTLINGISLLGALWRLLKTPDPGR